MPEVAGVPVAALVTVPVTTPARSSRIAGTVTVCPARSVTTRACFASPVPPVAPTHCAPYADPPAGRANRFQEPAATRPTRTFPEASEQYRPGLSGSSPVPAGAGVTQAPATGAPVAASTTRETTFAAGVRTTTAVPLPSARTFTVA